MRWAALLARRAGLPLPSTTIVAAWHRAQRSIAARVALAAWREELTEGHVSGGALTLQGELSLPLRRLGAFGLHTPDLEAPLDPRLLDPQEVWARVAAGLPAPTRERIATELADSAFNLGLAMLAEHLRPQWAHDHRNDPRSRSPEHWVTEGHPWHPMSKTRLGLRPAEHARIAPELFANAPLRALDVDASLVQMGPEGLDRLAPWLGRAPAGMVRIPVHHCQLTRLARRFPTHFGTTIRPTELTAHGRSLLSLRTVAIDAPSVGKLHLKLALGVLTTSARRVVSPMSVANGPAVSRLIAEIQRADPICAALRVVPESITAGLRREVMGPDAGELGVIVRDGLAFSGPRGGRTWVCAGLGAPAPLTGHTGVRWLAEGLPGSRRQRARALLARYLEALVPPVLRFAVAHGVALEAHLQNTLVEPSPQGPRGFVMRDLGGIRIHGPRLHAAGHALTVHPDSFIVTDDLAELQGKVAHTLLHAHLTAVLGWIDDALDLPPEEGWMLVHRCITSHLDNWAHEPGLRAACEADRAAWLAPTVRAKALLRMRIDDRSSDYSYVTVDNPLARVDPEARFDP